MEEKIKKYGIRYGASAGIGIIIAVATIYFLPWLTWLSIPLAIIVFLAIVGLVTVPEKYRGVVERFRKYDRTLMPGLQWILLPGIVENIKVKRYIKERILPLWQNSDEKIPVWIDFVDGSAQPIGAEAFVEIYNPDSAYVAPNEEEIKKAEKEQSDKGEGVRSWIRRIKEEKRRRQDVDSRNGVYRSAYNIEDVDRATIEQIENAGRSYLSSLTIDEAIKLAKAGYDLLDGLKQKKRGSMESFFSGLNEKSEGEKLESSLLRYGIRLLKVTIGDFELSPGLVEARDRVHKAQKDAAAAQYYSEAKTLRTVGVVLNAMAKSRNKKLEEIQAEIDKDDALKKEFLQKSYDLLVIDMERETGSLHDIRVQGGVSGLEKTLLNLATVFGSAMSGQLVGGKSSGKSSSERKDEEKSEGKKKSNPELEKLKLWKEMADKS